MDEHEKALKGFAKEYKDYFKTKTSKTWTFGIDYHKYTTEFERVTVMPKRKIGELEFDTDDFKGLDLDSLLGDISDESEIKINDNNEDDFVTINGQTIDVNNFWIDDYLVDSDKVVVFQLVEQQLKNRGYANILALGEAGTGKTTFATKLAQFFDIESEMVDVSTKTEPLQWFGQREIVNGNTVWGKTPLTNKLANGNMIAIFDELNRTRGENVNTLLPLFDFRRSTRIMDMDIVAGGGTIFYCTANIGYEYSNTTRFDKASYDRFDIYLNFNHLSRERELEVLSKRGIDEDNANFCVDLMSALRDAVTNGHNDLNEFTFNFSLSPRRTIMLGTHLQMGLNHKQAIQLAITNGANKDDLVNIQSIASKVMQKHIKIK